MSRKRNITRNYLTLMIVLISGFLMFSLQTASAQYNTESNMYNSKNFIFPMLNVDWNLNLKPVKSIKKKKVSSVKNDTLSQNKILKIYSSNNNFYTVEIDLKDPELPIKIFIFNMLAKKVKDVDTKLQSKEYYFNASDIPNGVYLCVLQGSNFKHAKKFIISR